jgi:hypothetical protein
MMLARAIHFDESDMNVFHSSARTGEWCISGGFEFSNWSEAASMEHHLPVRR